MFHPELSEIALFGTDVATDWVNGYNMIMENHVIWGTVMCILPFAPVAIVGPLLAYDSQKRKYGKPCAILMILLLYMPAVVIATPCYIGFVLLTGLLKVYMPNLSGIDGDFLFGLDGNDWIKYAAWMRITEIVTESCPQAMLGEYNVIHT